MDETWPIATRREPRGEFPEHTDRPRPVRTREEALRIARQRLADWIEEHRNGE